MHIHKTFKLCHRVRLEMHNLCGSVAVWQCGSTMIEWSIGARRLEHGTEGKPSVPSHFNGLTPRLDRTEARESRYHFNYRRDAIAGSRHQGVRINVSVRVTIFSRSAGHLPRQRETERIWWVICALESSIEDSMCLSSSTWNHRS